MASIKNLKKDTNSILADIIEDCLIWQLENPEKEPAESEEIISEAISAFDGLIVRINEKKKENGKAHFDAIVKDLKETALSLVERIEKL